MTGPSIRVPGPPGYTFDWQELTDRFAWIQALADCPQDATWHAEGNVWIHTRMVCEALTALDEYRALDDRERVIVFVAALLHDVAKPECTRTEEDGRITSRGHSLRGEIRARRILWELGMAMRAREEVARIIESHQVPFFAIDKADADRVVHRISQCARLRLLALVAEADARGREAKDKQHLIDNVELFRELARDEDCYDGPRRFASDHARFEYFRTPGRNPHYAPHEGERPEIVMLSGLPASGKDTWLAGNAAGRPVVSLDVLRDELGIAPTEPQGRVIQSAKEMARYHLRQRRSFIWNATSISRKHRAPLLDLFAEYGARIRIDYLETTAIEQQRRNRERERTVPADAMERMLVRWQVPDRTEAHEVYWNGEPV